MGQFHRVFRLPRILSTRADYILLFVAAAEQQRYFSISLVIAIGFVAISRGI